MAELDEWTDQLTKDIQSFEGDWQKYHGNLLDLNKRIIEIYENAPAEQEHERKQPEDDITQGDPASVGERPAPKVKKTKYRWSIIMGHFHHAIRAWENNKATDEDIIEIYEDDQNEQEKRKECEQAEKPEQDVQILNFPFTGAYDDMYESWQTMRRHLETFTFEREKQTKRIVGAVEEIESLKREIESDQAKLREEQEQMRKEQAVLREYFDTLKSQNEALIATRSASASGESSTLKEIKDMIKGLKDE